MAGCVFITEGTLLCRFATPAIDCMDSALRGTVVFPSDGFKASAGCRETKGKCMWTSGTRRISSQGDILVQLHLSSPAQQLGCQQNTVRSVARFESISSLDGTSSRSGHLRPRAKSRTETWTSTSDPSDVGVAQRDEKAAVELLQLEKKLIGDPSVGQSRPEPQQIVIQMLEQERDPGIGSAADSGDASSSSSHGREWEGRGAGVRDTDSASPDPLSSSPADSLHGEDSRRGVEKEKEMDMSGQERVDATMPFPGDKTLKSSESKTVKAAWEALVRWSRRIAKSDGEDALVKTTKIAILGGGSFGTAIGVLLARNKSEMDVVMLMRDGQGCRDVNEHHLNKRYFPHHHLPPNMRATLDPREALDGAQFCIHAVPVQSSFAFLQGISAHVPPTLPILSVSKGLEASSAEMMSQLIPRALQNPRQPLAVLSGPSFSIELMDKLPTAIVAASKDPQLARAAQQLLASRHLRVNTSSDVVGVEIAGALKNVLAIAAGIVEGMDLGNNCMAALVAQGCAEIRWLAEKMGAKSATLAGLSGAGDIMLTCFVSLSRNRSVGVRLGKGEKLEAILASMHQVAEGVATAGAVIALARKYRVQMPVLTAVARILDNELTPKKAVLELMSLPQVEER